MDAPGRLFRQEESTRTGVPDGYSLNQFLVFKRKRFFVICETDRENHGWTVRRFGIIFTPKDITLEMRRLKNDITCVHLFVK